VSATRPLVSVGVPVRNGAAALGRALDSLVAQTYPHLEILVSDNASSDATEAIAREYAARDARVRYMRQPCAVDVVSNFRAPVEASRGEFFLWAAYDDVRDANYVETLLRGFERVPDASLCFSAVAEFNALDDANAARLVEHRFETLGLTFEQVARQQSSGYCLHIYGLIASAYLREYSWHAPSEGWDVPLLYWLAMRGPFVFEPGTRFTYFRPAAGRTIEARALENNFGRASAWWPEQLTWACACAVADGSRRAGRPIGFAYACAFLYFHVLPGGRGVVARWTPTAVRNLYRRATNRPRLASPNQAA
jgi:glycosyltransferase involved in cell wall biosynthesis